MSNLDGKNSYSAVIADDHAIVREGVAQVLASIEGVSVVGQADNGLTAIALVRKHHPDLLVLDSGMPHARGIEVYLEARRCSPETRTILFTGFTSLTLLSDWLDAGVNGLLLKTCEPEEMKEAFTAVLNGAPYVADNIVQMLKQATQVPSLSPREREVLSLIAAGHSNSSLSDRLHISTKTAEKHRASLMKKLGVHSVSELMVYALRRGLLEDEKQTW